MYDSTTFKPFDLHHNARQRDKLKAIGLGFFILIAVIALGYHMITQIMRTSVKDDLCLGGRAPHTHVAVLIDITDVPSKDQYRTLKMTLHHRLHTLPVGARLSLYLLTPDEASSVITPLFSRCKPEDGTDANRFTQTKEGLEQRYDEEFLTPFEAELAKLDDVGPSGTSPLLEALYTISTYADFTKAKRRILEVWSDMLQSSKVMDHFKGNYSISALEQEQSLYITKMAELAGTDVHIYRFKSRKYPHHQTKAHTTFWTEYFQTFGVGEYTWTQL